MSISNTAHSYGRVARTLHWSVAALILIMLPLGFVAQTMAEAVNAPGATPSQNDLSRVIFLFSLHKTLGVLVLVMAIVRIGWALSQPRPAPMHPDRSLENFAAETIHFALYGALIAVPLTGWIHHAATSGYAPIWGIGQSLPSVPQSATVAQLFSTLHELSVWLLIGSLALHVAGALKHHLIDRDQTLARMTRGARGGHKTHTRATPALAALALWAMIPLAASLGGSLSARDSAPALDQAQGEWQVTTAHLGIAITQMGNRIEGQFADWTADIQFDPDSRADQKGQVTVTVSIPSLTLGTVTDQAMGADYFNAQEHPTATFTAPILQQGDGHVAPGTLTIKDVPTPLTLPFELSVTGNSATAQGRATTDRRAFGLGAGVTDDGTLGFDVEIYFELSATRS